MLWGQRFQLFTIPTPFLISWSITDRSSLPASTDIAAMKTAAVVQRARQRDFYDIYYLIKKLGLEKIISATYQKFPLVRRK